MRIILLLIFSLYLIFPLYSKQGKGEVKFFFRLDKSVFDPTYMSNREALDNLILVLKKTQVLSIEIVGSASPEGTAQYNLDLSRARAKAIERYLQKEFKLSSMTKIEVQFVGEDWIELCHLGESDPDVARILPIINSNNSFDKKETILRSTNNSNIWKKLNIRYFEVLRGAKIGYTHFDMNRLSCSRTVKSLVVDPFEFNFSKKIDINRPLDNTLLTTVIPLFAVKTNLLYDAVTALNLELEAPIASRWSVALEGVFPWWNSYNHEWTMQLLMGQLGAKYWINSTPKSLQGFFVGGYASIGKYDLQFFQREGEQGNFYSVGAQFGYAHAINKHLHLEYGVNVGFLRSRLREYKQVDNTEWGSIKVWNFPWERKRRDWFGPTGVKVSLVWYLKRKKSL